MPGRAWYFLAGLLASMCYTLASSMEKEQRAIVERGQHGLRLEQHHLELEAERHACRRPSERRLIGRQLAAVRAEIAHLAANSAESVLPDEKALPTATTPRQKRLKTR